FPSSSHPHPAHPLCLFRPSLLPFPPLPSLAVSHLTPLVSPLSTFACSLPRFAGSRRKLSDVSIAGGDTTESEEAPAEAARPQPTLAEDRESKAVAAGSSAVGKGSGRTASEAGRKGVTGAGGSKCSKQAA
ncbi:unnamed protein product, partial [Closterium sp. Naga37s-1]